MCVLVPWLFLHHYTIYWSWHGVAHAGYTDLVNLLQPVSIVSGIVLLSALGQIFYFICSKPCYLYCIAKCWA